MVRPNLDNLPEFTLPAGFTMRWYESGDEAHWLRIHLAADPFNQITPELFRKQFGGSAARGLPSPSEKHQNVPSASSSSSKTRVKSRSRARTTTRTSPCGGCFTQPASADEPGRGVNSALRDLRQRQCYLLAPSGEVIGTGTAWFDNNFAGARWGRVHWLAMMPEFQRRGLAKPLMTAICRRLAELGHERVYLSTSTARPAAIGLYLRFGFEPWIQGPEDAVAWSGVLPAVVRRVCGRRCDPL